MTEFVEKLEAILKVIEKESGLYSDYTIYENRSKAFSILTELHLNEEQETMLLKMLADTPSDIKIALVILDSEDDGLEESINFLFDETDVNEMYDTVIFEEEEEKEAWEIALAKEDFGIAEIKEVREALLDEKHGFILEILRDSYDILDFVKVLKHSPELKPQLVQEVTKGLSSLLTLETFALPIVIYISSDNTVAFVGDENFKALKGYILDSIFHEKSQPSSGVVEYEDGWGYDCDIEEDEEDEEDYEYGESYDDEDEDDKDENGCVAPFWLV